jgi:hypothetical protein
MADEQAQPEVEAVDWDNLEDTAPKMEEAEEASDEVENEEVKVEEVEENADEEEAKEEPKAEEAKQEAKEEKEEEESKEEPLDISSLSDDAMIKVKVDGELQEISLKDYKNGISGEKAIAKRFSEYDRKEKEFKAEIADINNFVNELGSTMKQSSVLEGIFKVGELVGLGPHQMRQAVAKEILPYMEKIQEMGEEQARLEYEKEDLEYKKKQFDSTAKQTSQKHRRS